jgi:hypothetical protein
MKIKIMVFLPVLAAIVLTACASPVEQPAPTRSETSGGQPGQPDVLVPAWDQTVLVDEQGAVVVEVTPLNLNNHGDTLEFDIALNTHSVDLGMDLASLAILSTDTGMIVQAINWDAPRGGHHVSGKLIFPSTFDGNSILDEANQITLQIRDVDANIREFAWRLQ